MINNIPECVSIFPKKLPQAWELDCIEDGIDINNNSYIQNNNNDNNDNNDIIPLKNYSGIDERDYILGMCD